MSKIILNLLKNIIRKNKNLKNNNDNNNNIMSCIICLEEEKEKEIVKLCCGHEFHYECIILEYLSKKNRLCPYCRKKGCVLELMTGPPPIKGIHLEYWESKEVKKCNAILRSGPNKGKMCGNTVTSKGYCLVKEKNDIKYYCSRHKKKIINI